jgi:hypothetical protein
MTGSTVQQMLDNYPKQARRAARGFCYCTSLAFDILDDIVFLAMTPVRMLLLVARDLCVDFAPMESDEAATQLAERRVDQ